MQVSTLPRKRLPAAWAVLAEALALLFILVSAVALLAWNSYRDASEHARSKVSTATQVVATHIEWLMAASLLLMDETDHVVGGTLSTLKPEARAQFDLHLRHMPAGVSVALADPKGHVVFSTAGDADDSGLSEAYGLTAGQLTRERPWHVSAMVKDPGSGVRVFLIAQRIERNGVPIGAVIVRIPLEVMASVWRSLELGPGSTMGLLRDDGWQAARHPAVDTPQNLARYVLFTDYLPKSPDGVYDAVSPVDGEQMRASLAAAVERNNLLMREIHHRTKNNLQSVASLLKLQPISEEVKSAMTARIAAMSALHEQAYRSDRYSEANLRDYLQSLVAAERAELVISDTGAGFLPTGQERGMGSRLIRAFAQQLGNDYGYARQGGTRFAIRFAAKRGSEAA